MSKTSTDLDKLLAPHPVCHCGDCDKAMRIALEEFQRHYSGHGDQPGCLHWYLAISAAHSVIAQMLLGNFPEAEPNLNRVGEAMTEWPVLEALLPYVQAVIDARAVELKN